MILFDFSRRLTFIRWQGFVVTVSQEDATNDITRGIFFFNWISIISLDINY